MGWVESGLCNYILVPFLQIWKSSQELVISFCKGYNISEWLMLQHIFWKWRWPYHHHNLSPQKSTELYFIFKTFLVYFFYLPKQIQYQSMAAALQSLTCSYPPSHCSSHKYSSYSGIFITVSLSSYLSVLWIIHSCVVIFTFEILHPFNCYNLQFHF